MAAIAVSDLRKSYGPLEAVKGVSFEVAPGEVFALLGPNGAGKTTTVEILEGYRPRDGGSVSVLGMDPERGGVRLRERMGIVLQECGIEELLTPREVLERQAGYYPSPRPVDEMIALVDLADKAKARIRTLSGGQRRRLDLALALVGDPELLFLDEPTTGFDPQARRHAWDLVKRLCKLGKTIFLTTHYMEEAQYLADRVAVISGGRLVALGAPDSIGGRDTDVAQIRFTLPDRVSMSELPLAARVDDGRVLIEAADVTGALHALTAWALGRDIALGQLTVTRPLARGRVPGAGQPVRSLALVMLQIRYEQKLYWRSPSSAMFTFLFPILLLVIFASLNYGATLRALGGISYNQYYVPGIVAFGVISACFSNLAIGLCFRRDSGVLKRIRGTPLPPWVFMAGNIGSSLVVSAILTVLTTAVGVAFYGVSFPGRYGAFVLTLVVGAFCFCSLGLAITALIPVATASPAIVNGLLFPILFISGTFFPVDGGSWLARIASVFPIRHFEEAVFTRLRPARAGVGRQSGVAPRDARLGHCRGRHRGPGLPLGAAPKVEELQALTRA